MTTIEFETPTLNEKGEIIRWTHHSRWYLMLIAAGDPSAGSGQALA
jgi:hypothetical protein